MVPEINSLIATAAMDDVEQDVLEPLLVTTSKFIPIFMSSTSAKLRFRSTQDCFSHDMCSYWNDASGGASDDNCGAAYTAAEDDYLLGGVDGCAESNPSSTASKPTSSPTCS